MKKDNWDDIEVKRRKAEKVLFESKHIQSAYDRIEQIRDESKSILEDIDSSELKQKVDEIDIKEVRDDAVGCMDDIVDEISRFKDRMIDSEKVPDGVIDQYRNTQAYLNRDEDYLRRAKRKLARLDEGKLTDKYEINFRVVELCDKAIAIRPDNFDAYVLKAQSLVNLKRYSEAIDAYITALALEDDVELWLAIANANRLNRDFDDALEVYDSILEKYKKTFEVLKGKAFVYFDLNDFAKCDKLLKQANDIDYLDEESFRIWSESLEKLRKE